MDATRITQIIEEFICTSPENSLKNAADEAVWEEALVGFSSGSDPIFHKFKEHVGDFHYTPGEIFNLTFAKLPATSNDSQ
jgi:epoxyqueuosine reductase